MHQFRTLASLEEGESARVQSLHHNGAVRRRLQDIGLTEHASVQCVQKSPSGEIAAYRIRGAVMALRQADAVLIAISKEESPF